MTYNYKTVVLLEFGVFVNYDTRKKVTPTMRITTAQCIGTRRFAEWWYSKKRRPVTGTRGGASNIFESLVLIHRSEFYFRIRFIKANEWKEYDYKRDLNHQSPNSLDGRCYETVICTDSAVEKERVKHSWIHGIQECISSDRHLHWVPGAPRSKRKWRVKQDGNRWTAEGRVCTV